MMSAFDSPDTPNLGPILHTLIGGRLSQDKLFDVSERYATQKLKVAVSGVQVGHLVETLYQARHGGASRDHLLKRRKPKAIKGRGRWLTDASLMRYMKAGRVQAAHREVKVTTLLWCELCQRHWQQLLQGTWVPPRAPPGA